MSRNHKVENEKDFKLETLKKDEITACKCATFENKYSRR